METAFQGNAFQINAFQINIIRTAVRLARMIIKRHRVARLPFSRVG